MTKREDVEALLAKHDRIDVYFNNAGIPETVKPLAEITREEWDAVIDVNLTRCSSPPRSPRPKLKGGMLLVTGSIIANRPRAGPRGVRGLQGRRDRAGARRSRSSSRRTCA